jgi:hypothetical protein
MANSRKNDATEKSNESAMLQGALLPTMVVGLICIIIFSILKGKHGLYGALVAQFVVIIFFLVHLLVSKLSRGLDPMSTMALAMFSYVTKLTAIGSFLIILTRLTPREVIDRNSFGISAIALTGAWLGGEIKSYLGLKTHLPLPPRSEIDKVTD